MNGFESLCDDILVIDPKIRFAGIYDRGDLYTKMQKGLESYLTLEETKMSVRQAFIRWKTRETYAPKTGNPIFVLGEYEKIYRITIPFGNDGLILVSMEKDIQPSEIAQKVIELQKKYIKVNN